MTGNLTTANILFHIMTCLNTNGLFCNSSIHIQDIKTGKPMYSINSNTTSFSKFVKAIFPQNNEADYTKVLSINTMMGKACEIVVATDSKFPVMKNMIRRISNLNDFFKKAYDEVNIKLTIDGKEYEVDGYRLLDYVIKNEPTLFGKKIQNVAASFYADKDFIRKKFICKIVISIVTEGGK